MMREWPGMADPPQTDRPSQTALPAHPLSIARATGARRPAVPCAGWSWSPEETIAIRPGLDRGHGDAPALFNN
jgi:hypothetical protein